MLVGAVSGFAATLATGSATLGLSPRRRGYRLSLIFGFLTLNPQTNQVATGLALTLFGMGFQPSRGPFGRLPVNRVEGITIRG